MNQGRKDIRRVGEGGKDRPLRALEAKGATWDFILSPLGALRAV